MDTAMKVLRSLSHSSNGAAEVPDEAIRRRLVESRGRITAYLKRRIGRDDADDVFQLFAVKVLERGRALRDIDALPSWMQKILATLVADHLRRKGRDRRHRLLASLQGITQVQAPEGAKETPCTCFYLLLPNLPSHYSDIIHRIDLLNEPRACVAASLGISPGLTDVRLHRARRRLRQELERLCTSCIVDGPFCCSCGLPARDEIASIGARACKEPARPASSATVTIPQEARDALKCTG